MPIWSPIPSLLEGFLIEVLLGVKTAPIGAAGSWASMKRFTWPQSLYSPGLRPGAGAATSSCRDGLAAGFSMDGSAAFTPGGVTARATAGTAAASRGGMAEDGRGGKDLALKASWLREGAWQSPQEPRPGPQPLRGWAPRASGQSLVRGRRAVSERSLGACKGARGSSSTARRASPQPQTLPEPFSTGAGHDTCDGWGCGCRVSRTRSADSTP